jgi:hypothetical protein
MTGVGNVTWFWSFLAALAVLVFIFLLVPVSIRVQFQYSPEASLGFFQISVWPGLKYARTVPGRPAGPRKKPRRQKISLLPKKDPLRKKVRIFRKAAESALPVLPSFLRRLTLQTLRWHTRIGLADPFATAVAAGFLWGLKSSLVSFVYRLARPSQPPDLAVVPDFCRAFCTFYCAFYFESRISVRPADIVFAGAKAGFRYLKSYFQ